jgi:hypothetical protein
VCHVSVTIRRAASCTRRAWKEMQPTRRRCLPWERCPTRHPRTHPKYGLHHCFCLVVGMRGACFHGCSGEMPQDGKTPLIAAASHGYLQLVQLLLQPNYKVSVDTRDSVGGCVGNLFSSFRRECVTSAWLRCLSELAGWIHTVVVGVRERTLTSS